MPIPAKSAAKIKIQQALAAGRLSLEAVNAITDISEALQQTIVNMGGLLGESKPDKGISSIVYSGIRKVNHLLTAGVDKLTVSGQQQEPGLSRSDAMHAAVSALNGVMGDRLLAQNNALVVNMAFRHKGQTLTLDALQALIKQAGGKVLLMVHGLCMNDVQWTRNTHNHGEKLAGQFNMLPVYLHYNSGRHISENGRELATLLQTLMNTVKAPLSLNILAHSMGGLVSRSACHYAKQAGQSWLTQLDKMIFLGTPHHGAPLEKGSNWLGQLLDISPYSSPFVPLINLRSSGVTDLRYGNLCDEDWQDKDRFSLQGDARQPVPLPAGVTCYTLAASMAKKPAALRDKLIGDGLVAIDSALGKHREHRHSLAIAKHRQWLGYNLNHMQLLSDSRVYETLATYLAEQPQG